MIWIEPCAGAASVALYLLGGPGVVPPVGYMGGKRRLAPTIVGAMLGEVCRPSEVHLIDASTWGRIWGLLLGPEGPEVCAILRRWSDYDPIDLWHRLVAQPPPDDDPPWATAQWLWLQARSASTIPVWHDARGWRMGDKPSRALKKATSQLLQGKQAGGGIASPTVVADRIDRIRAAIELSGARVHVHHARGEEVAIATTGPTAVYMDPPYVGATSYECDMPRAAVLDLARRWVEVAEVVAISEAEPLPLDGWHHLDITAGPKPEWLTISRPPRRVPAVQLPLITQGVSP